MNTVAKTFPIVGDGSGAVPPIPSAEDHLRRLTADLVRDPLRVNAPMARSPITSKKAPIGMLDEWSRIALGSEPVRPAELRSSEARAPVPLPVDGSGTSFQEAIAATRHCWTQSCGGGESRGAQSDLSLHDADLVFYVSSDEEHVEIAVIFPGMIFHLGARSHNYLLLTLARRRIADAAAGFGADACGWIYRDELSHDPSMSGSRLNIDTFRLRRRFGSLGIVDARGIVERRAISGQVRIGVARLAIHRA